MTRALVRLEIQDGAAHVTLNRAEKRNAVNGEMIQALDDVFARLVAEREARVVLLKGDGPAFSSGIDFNFLASLGQGDEAMRGVMLRDGISRIQSVLNRIERLEKPVVALLHGVAAGLGLELALAADFRIATASARLGLPEALLGLIPDCGGTTRLTRTVGPALAKELIMLGDLISAGRALSIGLLHRVAPDDELETAGKEFAAKLLDRPEMALGLAKRAITWGAGVDAMTHMEIEAYVQSVLIAQKDFPNILLRGLEKLKKNK